MLLNELLTVTQARMSFMLFEDQKKKLLLKLKKKNIENRPKDCNQENCLEKY